MFLNKYELLVLAAAVFVFLIIMWFGIGYGSGNETNSNSTVANCAYITDTTTLDQLRDCFRD